MRASASFSVGPSVCWRTRRTTEAASGSVSHGSSSQGDSEPATHGSGAVRKAP